MASATAQDLLKKINYIEVDLEIQKQILFSIPSTQTEEIEKTVQIIAEKTKEIESLREEIKKIDPEEYKRIMIFEEAVKKFKELASTNNFESIVSREVGGECTLLLANEVSVECLIKANDAEGNWTIITLEGDLRQYLKAEVSEQPPAQPEQ